MRYRFIALLYAFFLAAKLQYLRDLIVLLQIYHRQKKRYVAMSIYQDLTVRLTIFLKRPMTVL